MLLKRDQFAIRLVSIHRFTHDDNTMLFGARPYHILTYRVSGEAVLKGPDGDHFQRKGAIALIPANTPFTRESTMGQTISVRFLADELLTDDILIVEPDNSAYFERKFDELEEANEKSKGFPRHECMSILYRILMQMEQEHMNQLSGPQAIAYEMAEYISSNLSDSELTVSRLCERYHMSDTCLRRIFVKNFGIPPVQYLNQVRLSYAKELLATEHYSVTEVAEKCGYKSASYFSACFKKEMGCPPKEFTYNQAL